MIRETSDMTLHQRENDGHLPLIDNLVDFRYHVDAVDADGCTAMFYAVEYEHRDIIELLLRNGTYEKNRNARTGDSCSQFGEDRKRDFISLSC
jgi:ankyrin repeat protein